MNRGTQWIAIAFSCWLTWAIFMSNTHHGSPALEDAVAWIIHILVLIALNTYRMEDEFLAELGPKTHVIKWVTDVNVLAQVFLLFATSHWWLGFLRGGSELMVRRNVDIANHNVKGWGHYLRSYQ